MKYVSQEYHSQTINELNEQYADLLNKFALLQQEDNRIDLQFKYYEKIKEVNQGNKLNKVKKIKKSINSRSRSSNSTSLESPPIQCNICQKFFTLKSSLRKHLRNIHKLSPEQRNEIHEIMIEI